MAKKQAGEGQIKARVLTDCVYGKVNDVVVLADAEAATATGWVDTAPEAVAYAELLVPEDAAE